LPAVGDRIGILVSASNASYELIVTAASGDTLNGVAGGTGWSKLFITGEVVVMRCVAANSPWIVEQDGRIPCKMILTLTLQNRGSYRQYRYVSQEGNMGLSVGSTFCVTEVLS